MSNKKLTYCSKLFIVTDKWGIRVLRTLSETKGDAIKKLVNEDDKTQIKESWAIYQHIGYTVRKVKLTEIK